jgi:hypothetical protein
LLVVVGVIERHAHKVEGKGVVVFIRRKRGKMDKSIKKVEIDGKKEKKGRKRESNKEGEQNQQYIIDTGRV